MHPITEATRAIADGYQNKWPAEPRNADYMTLWTRGRNLWLSEHHNTGGLVWESQGMRQGTDARRAVGRAGY